MLIVDMTTWTLAFTGHEKSRSEKSLYPNEAQVNIHVILTKALNPIRIEVLLQIEQSVKVFLYHYITKVYRYRPYEIQLILGPKLIGNITDPVFQGVVPANLVASPTATTMDSVKVYRNRMSNIAEWADDDVLFHRPSLPTLSHLVILQQSIQVEPSIGCDIRWIAAGF